MSNLVKTGEFSVDEVSLIKATICKGANDVELRLFLRQCKMTGLNPLARQIYSVERKEYRDGQWKVVRSIQVSIDGFRLIAERSGKYAGQTETLWCGEDAVWKDAWLSNKPPAAAKVGVMRTDFKEPCWGVARFDAYCQRKKEGTLTHMWANMGDVMIAKCAEALALRKAFPQELSGLYTNDEMMQAEEVRDDKPYNTDHSKPPSPFKTAALRRTFQENLTKNFHSAISSKELKELMELDKPKFELMEASGDERDEMSLDELRKQYKIALDRLLAKEKEDDAPAFLREEKEMDDQLDAQLRDL